MTINLITRSHSIVSHTMNTTPITNLSIDTTNILNYTRSRVFFNLLLKYLIWFFTIDYVYHLCMSIIRYDRFKKWLRWYIILELNRATVVKVTYHQMDTCSKLMISSTYSQEWISRDLHAKTREIFLFESYN